VTGARRLIAGETMASDYIRAVKAARRLLLPGALAIVLVALVIDFWRRPEPIGIDFHTYAAAAQVGLQHGWAHIYDQALVAAEQKRLAIDQVTQPFLSPPPVAWLAAALAPLPYLTAYYVWAAVTLAAYAAALGWSAASRGLVRWVVVGAAIAPWWVLHAIHLGQVVPLVAAGVVVAWRLLREQRDVAAGIALAAVLLKPNTAVLVPLALLAAGRYRTFVTWSVAGAALAAVALVTMGIGGVSAYLSQLTAPLPGGASSLTLEGALGLSGTVALALRVLIAGIAMVAAFRLRSSVGLVIAVGILASLLAAPYLHGSDLCLLSAAVWIVWEERPALAWRAPLAVGWLAASPFADASGLGPGLNRWPLIELALLVAIVVISWRVKPAIRPSSAFG
jgi:alpha-1,2-mannosyltransferase